MGLPDIHNIIDNKNWFNLFNNNEIIDSYTINGKELRDRKRIELVNFIKRTGVPYEIEFEDTNYKCLFINYGLLDSISFLGEIILDEFNYDIAWIYHIKYVNNKIVCQYSLRSKNVDVSKIAQRYNGGGHKNSAGFDRELNDDILSCLTKYQK
jgi:hypothetical protein